jgi:glutamine amidotransferase
MWMHNGGVAQFDKVSHLILDNCARAFLLCLTLNDYLQVKRKLLAVLKEEIFLFVQGNTDSEWAFALFLNYVSSSLPVPR